MNRFLSALITLAISGNVPLWAQKKATQNSTLEEQYKIAAGQGWDKLNGIYWKNTPADRISALQATVKGTFWRNPEWIKALGLSGDQQKKMDEVFQQYRLRLIDLTAALEKEEIILEPLFGTTPPTAENTAKILTQIDRIAEARAELEKANSKMLVGILQILNAEQWEKLTMVSKTAKWLWK